MGGGGCNLISGSVMIRASVVSCVARYSYVVICIQ